ncbi:hypothetical protein [Thermoflexus sp.]|uniref:hypothetical protein n=1 Tax=Thermoflexus sp. TaxID=1969742 RepID=UPI0025E82D67|nr:hypothetical protein [Thermoflexus sp.]MDW8180911.1 hypothetical protein [Anaerolineae bacterium]MCS6963250.1 hypothetical protein [Thermoflexus sp.]MCS7351454.1 hypothetical protein [Thermoflexus sp.]MCX7691235.1 hypothetical protein [Thermoflexus sp.]MDW8184987.1 hypothetical protein [Anaerolineae bacterium]
MPSIFWISLLTFATTGAFAVAVLRRYVNQRQWHLLAWGIGLLSYSIGTLAQAILSVQFDGFLFKLWYWLGAMVVAPWLGQGTVFLLARRGKAAWISFWAILALSAVGLLVVFGSPLNPSAYRPGVDLSGQFQQIFATAGAARALRSALAILLNTAGTVMLVGGALYSVFLLQRRQAPAHRIVGVALIAVGGLLPALGGTLILLGNPDLKYWGQLLGGLLLFAGFLVSTRERPALAPGIRGPA